MRSPSVASLYLGELTRIESSLSSLNNSPTPSLSQSQPLPPSQAPIIDLAVWEKIYLKIVQFGYRAQCIPVYYDKTRGILRITKSKLILFAWLFRVATLTLDNIYLLYISPQVTLKTVGEQELLDFWIHTISRIIANLLSLAMAVDLQGTVQVFNTMVATRRIWNAKFGAWSADFSGHLEHQLRRFVQIGGVFACFHPIFPFLMHVTARQSKRYWGSQLLPAEVYNSIPGMTFSAVNDLLLSMAAIQNTAYGATIMFSFFILIRFWTTSIIERVSISKATKFEVPLFQYRCLLTFARIYNCCLGKLIVPLLISSACTLLTLMYSILIMAGGSLPSFVLMNMVGGALLITFALYTVIHGAGKMLTRSRDLIQLLLEKERNLRRRKFLRSCGEMRMYVGQFFYVKESTYPTMMKWIADQSITIILALG